MPTDVEAQPTPAILSDAELTALALAADPDAPVDADAVPWLGGTPRAEGLLPQWYMPAPAAGVGRPRRGAIAILIVASLVALNAVGLCVTYGILVVA